MRALAALHPLRSSTLRGAAVVVAASLALVMSACGEGEPTAGTSVPAATTPVSGTGPSTPVDGTSGSTPGDGASASTPESGTSPAAGTGGGPAGGGAFGAELTAEQLATFERANSKLINLTNATDADLDRRILQTKAACDRLDRSVPMLATFAARCAPTMQLGRQTTVLGQRCGGSGQEGQCGRILRRLASTMEAVASTGRAFKVEAKALTDDRACLKRLVPSAQAYRSLRSGAKYARQAATAIDAGDNATFQATIVDFQRVAVQGIDETGPAQPIVDKLREACGLVKTASPPGERER